MALADDERVGMTARLEGRPKEEKDLRKFGNKGRDFEAKVDSEQAGRGAFRKISSLTDKTLLNSSATMARIRKRLDLKTKI